MPPQSYCPLCAGGVAGGKYSAPDITLIISRKHIYTAGRSLRIVSFEVKTEENGNADAILEAAAHHQRTHFAYVLWHLPQGSQKESRLARVRMFAKKFGVGLILVRRLQQEGPHLRFDAVDFLEESEQHIADPELVDSYIEDRLSPAFKEKILSWLPKDF
jgi:hypothetical protein